MGLGDISRAGRTVLIRSYSVDSFSRKSTIPFSWSGVEREARALRPGNKVLFSDQAEDFESPLSLSMTAVEKRNVDRVGACLCKTIRRTKRAFPPEFAIAYE
jgi:hypothetical protein